MRETTPDRWPMLYCPVFLLASPWSTGAISSKSGKSDPEMVPRSHVWRSFRPERPGLDGWNGPRWPARVPWRPRDWRSGPHLRDWENACAFCSSFQPVLPQWSWKRGSKMRPGAKSRNTGNNSVCSEPFRNLNLPFLTVYICGTVPLYSLSSVTCSRF